MIDANKEIAVVDRVVDARRRRWLVNAGASGLGLATSLLPGGLLAADGAAPAPAVDAAAAAAKRGDPAFKPAEPVRPIDELGVELTMLRLAASDFLIDLRYRVKDVARAQPLLERKVNPVLVNEATGDRFYIPQAPKIGALRQSATSKQPAALGRVYFMLFANPDRKLKAGERVTLYAGDSVVTGLVVR